MSADELYQMLQASQKTKDIPIAFLSNKAGFPEDFKHRLGLKETDYIIHHPYNVEVIRAYIEKVISSNSTRPDHK